MNFLKNNFKIFFLVSALLLVLFFNHLTTNPSFPEKINLKGSIEKKDIDIKNNETNKLNLNKNIYKTAKIQLLNVKFYYYPDAEVKYQIIKQNAQKGHPHLLGYHEIDGLYLKAVSESTIKEELTKWNYREGPYPYYILTGAEIRNMGLTAITDVKLILNFFVKTATLRVNPDTITTDYDDLRKQAKWSKWFSKTINIKIVPPGEYSMIYTDDISLCELLQKLGDKWPIYIKVTATIHPNSSKNTASRTLELLPDHFVTKTLR